MLSVLPAGVDVGPARLARALMRRLRRARADAAAASAAWECAARSGPLAESALAHCEWREGALEAAANAWRFARALGVPRLLRAVRGRFGDAAAWRLLRRLAAFGARADRIGRLLYRTKWRACLLYTSPSPRDRTRSRMPSSA